MATFVLCAGAYTGGWVWRDVGVEPALRDAGHLVFTPTYTGVGERLHLTDPAIDLTTHVQDILMVLKYEDLTDVILVGHSYGGMIIAAVAEQAAERISHLVSLDGYIPENGQSIADIAGADATRVFEDNARSHGDGWLLSPDWDDPDARVTTHPLAAVYTPVALGNPAAASRPRTYIYCTEGKEGDAVLRFTIDHIEKAKADPLWGYHEIQTDHDLAETDHLVRILLEIGATARSPRAGAAGSGHHDSEHVMVSAEGARTGVAAVP